MSYPHAQWETETTCRWLSHPCWPVGATTTFTPRSVHTLPTKHFKASIRNDLPVLPIPLTNMESGLKSEAFNNFVTFLMLKMCVQVVINATLINTTWSPGIKCTSAARTATKNAKLAGSMYITRCRFNFPRHTAKINSVSGSLKSRNRIYELARTESEIRVNDYNPLLES